MKLRQNIYSRDDVFTIKHEKVILNYKNINLIKKGELDAHQIRWKIV